MRCRLALLTLLLLAGTAAAADMPPPAGRYRCYQPPDFLVVSWFDFEADGTYRLQGGASARYAWEATGRRVRWLDGEHAKQGLVGIYQPPPDASHGPRRHTIVLARANVKPGSRAWDKLPQCYLTEH
jgi:hypothetical protein